MKILPQDKNNLVQWLFIAGSIVSIVAMVHQIKVNRLQLAELQKRSHEHLSFLPAGVTPPVKINPPLPVRKKNEIFALWNWYNPKIA